METSSGNPRASSLVLVAVILVIFLTSPVMAQCASGYFGEACDEICSCPVHSTCDDGLEGTGNCTCDPDWLGESCEIPENCYEARLEGAEQTSERFGYCVAVSSEADHAVIGTYTETVYMFSRQAHRWQQSASFELPGTNRAVCVSMCGNGTYAIVGSYFSNHAGTNSGAAYIYIQELGVWSFQTNLTALEPQEREMFGASVALSSDGVYAVVGARGSASLAGAVFVFERQGMEWTQQMYLNASDGEPADGVGYSVAVSADGSVIAAGVMRSASSNNRIGSVYIFVRSEENWVEQTRILGPPSFQHKDFGRSVALSAEGTVLAVGKGENHIGRDLFHDSGVYIFTSSGTEWSKEAVLFSSDGHCDDIFGYSVAVSGNVVVVGAPGADYNAGAAYMFVRDGTRYLQTDKFSVPGLVGDGEFATSVAVGENHVIVSHHTDNTDGRTDSGSVFVYKRCSLGYSGQLCDQCALGFYGPDCLPCMCPRRSQCDGGLEGSGKCTCDIGWIGVHCNQSAIPYQARLLSPEPSYFDKFGFSVSLSYNASHMVVGSVNSAGAYVFYRVGQEWTETELLDTDGQQSTVSIDDDALHIIVGHYEDNSPYPRAGSARVYVRNIFVQSWGLEDTLQASNVQENGKFGNAVGMSGDGWYCVVGSYQANAPNEDCGSVHIFAQNGSSWTEVDMLEGSGEVDSNFGLSVAISHNGSYVAVMANDGHFIFGFNGVAWPEQARTDYSHRASSRSGVGFSAQGDVLLVSDPSFHIGINYGIVRYLTRDGNEWTEQLPVDPRMPDANFYTPPISVTADGNTFVTGASDGNDHAHSSGTVYLYTYNGSDWATATRLFGEKVGSEYLGQSVAISGDGNYVVAGAPEANELEGAVYVFTCPDGFAGLPCTQCVEGRYGVDCLECSCPSNSTCDEGIDGSGSCTCDLAGFGIESNCTECGTGFFGLECNMCLEGYFGNNCSSCPSCMHGACDDGMAGAGGCECFDGFVGPECAGLEFEAKLSPPGDASEFGAAVAISGTGRRAVCSWGNDRFVVFNRSGSQWTFVTVLQIYGLGSAQEIDHVAMSDNGRCILVSDPGHVFVFELSESGWMSRGNISSPPNYVYYSPNYFATSVKMDSSANTAAVAAWGDSEHTGAVFVFYRSGDTWSDGEKVVGTELVDDDTFGRSLSISGDGNYLAVGAPRADLEDGAAFVFKRNGSQWDEMERFASPAPATHSFGVGIAISYHGEYLAIGWPGAPRDNLGNVGVVILYFRTGSEWTLRENQLLPAQWTGSGGFGEVLDFSTRILVAGSLSSGYVSVFMGNGSDWQLICYLAQDIHGHFFGKAVAISRDGRHAIVGAPDNSLGSVYAYDLSRWSPYTCEDGFFGSSCAPCPICHHGQCDDGRYGSGQCLCDHGFVGPNCQRRCRFDSMDAAPCTSPACASESDSPECFEVARQHCEVNSQDSYCDTLFPPVGFCQFGSDTLPCIAQACIDNRHGDQCRELIVEFCEDPTLVDGTPVEMPDGCRAFLPECPFSAPSGLCEPDLCLLDRSSPSCVASVREICCTNSSHPDCALFGSPPSVRTVHWDVTLTKVLVVFDQSMTASTGAFPCNSLLESDLLEEYICYWVSPRTISFTDTDHRFVLGETVGVQSCAAFAVNGFVPAIGESGLQLSTSGQPQAVVFYPEMVSLCSPFLIDASQSGGIASGGRSMDFEYSLTIDNVPMAEAVSEWEGDVQNVELIALAGIEDVVMSDEMIIALQVTVTNFLGIVSTPTSVTIHLQELPLPTVQLFASHRSAPSTTEVTIVAEAVFESQCFESGTFPLSFRWFCASCPVDFDELDVSKRILIIPPNFLPHYTLTFVLQTTMLDQSVNSSVSIQIHPPRCTVGIMGGRRQMISVQEPVILDAVTCVNVTRWFWLLENAHTAEVYELSSGGPSMYIPAFWPQWSTEPVMAIVTANDSYQQSCRASVLLQPQSEVEATPKLTLVTHRFDRISIFANFSGGLQMWKKSWRSPQVDNMAMLATYSTHKSALVVRKDALQPGTEYEFIFEQKRNGIVLRASISHTVAFPPSGGSCGTQPPTGESFRTQFTTICSGWVSENLPLRYRFGYLVAGAPRYLGPTSARSRIKKTLPPGNLTTFADIFDSVGNWVQTQWYTMVSTGDEPTVIELEQKLTVARHKGDGSEVLSVLASSFSEETSMSEEKTQLAADAIDDAMESLPDTADSVAEAASVTRKASESANAGSSGRMQQVVDSLIEKAGNVAKVDPDTAADVLGGIYAVDEREEIDRRGLLDRVGNVAAIGLKDEPPGGKPVEYHTSSRNQTISKHVRDDLVDEPLSLSNGSSIDFPEELLPFLDRDAYMADISESEKTPSDPVESSEIDYSFSARLMDERGANKLVKNIPGDIMIEMKEQGNQHQDQRNDGRSRERIAFVDYEKGKLSTEGLRQEEGGKNGQKRAASSHLTVFVIETYIPAQPETDWLVALLTVVLGLAAIAAVIWAAVSIHRAQCRRKDLDVEILEMSEVKNPLRFAQSPQ